ncbi:quinolinate synthase NadA [Tenuibacillus multivorans]|uniref:Quinolinate synthase n=1 Tax=Tenuibacillus multivorans TaxID=237069 RepID=A0A1G9Z752_9BACI|nr:quinolinate synthase NadA [Tenuibacillus multivorans]GEL77403.1 quinolinate synthase A [Tenuibacillus multivorans]SDN16356.1 quinolinate synthase [Tenuibacillus multivorans]
MNLLEKMESSISSIPDKYKSMSENELKSLVQSIKNELGDDLFIPGHHYQKDEVIQFADARGDSLQLAQLSSETSAKYIVFCGVHFMAETADILSTDEQSVYLPDLRAGCSMADMADMQQTEVAWDQLTELLGDTILPMTYVNSTAAIKSFVGQNGGTTVTSSNAKRVMEWAFTQKQRLLFLPDQHLGRNTAYELGMPLDEMAVWDPILEKLFYDCPLEDIKVILWKGHCSVHENFTEYNVHQAREQHPDMRIIVHPECRREVVELSDDSGSTKSIIDTIEQAPSGSKWAIGTEMNLVKRIIQENPDKEIISLNPHMCPCLTMNRIDLPHLAWSLDAIRNHQPINEIIVDEDTAHWARTALNRMLSL